MSQHGRARRGFRQAVVFLLSLSLLAPLAGPALAWKPKTHVYLAEQAMRDAVNDGMVTLYETDYETGRIIGTLGNFEVDPAVLQALREKPAQFLAGAVGPDAYPDILTGQQIIHPGTNSSLLGNPAAGQPASAPGADAWLTHLWRLAYRAEARPEMLDNAAFNLLRPRTDTPAIRAFVSGYLSHAAGDMFMHTFVNYYTGGDFAITPDPRNALKHLVLEGYVGDRTPDTSSPLSIEGVERFIYREMINATPDSILEERLLRGATSTSLPAIFSSLRNGLQRDVDRYDRERMSRSGPSRAAYASLHGPVAEYKKAWITDIEAGLQAWPAVAHQLSLALIYDPARDGMDMAAAQTIMSQYVKDHLASMLGVPDVLVASAAAISAMIAEILPPAMREAINNMQRDFLKSQFEQATGMKIEDLIKYLKEPIVHFNPVMATPGGGYNGREATTVNLSQFNRDVLHIDDPLGVNKSVRFEVNKFAPAFNTVQMIKMTFLSEKGMTDLLAALRAKGLDVPPGPWAPGRYENPMLGFLTSMDGDNRWQGTGEHQGRGGAFFLARGSADGWRHLFMKQMGERPGWLQETAPEQEPVESPTADASFQPIEWWAVRLDDVKYDAASGQGRSVVVTATFRNDSNEARIFHSDLYRTQKSIRPVLQGGSQSYPLARMEYVHPEGSPLPQWHYSPSTPIPTQGRITVKYVFDVGDAAAQRAINQWTLYEQRPRSALQPMLVRDGPSRALPVTAMASATPEPTPEAPSPAAPTAEQIERMKGYEGRYSTSWGTNVSFTVQGNELHGTGLTALNPSPRETIKLTLNADGSLGGTIRDEQGAARSPNWYNVTIRFNADGSAFTGHAVYTHNPGNDPGRAYTGQRIGGAASQNSSTPDAVKPSIGSVGVDGFTTTAYLDLKVDRVRRTSEGYVEIVMIARNRGAERRGSPYDPQSFSLEGSDGMEYRTDGNHYGDSAEDRPGTTNWIQPEAQGRITYVFPRMPAGVTPSRLILRESGAQTAVLDLPK